MAITKTRALAKAEVFPAADTDADTTHNDAHPTMCIYYHDVIDDADDDDLPASFQTMKTLTKYDSDGNATVVTGELQLVQDIAGAIWS